MSYSRWSNSRWYTFWNASSGKTKDEQVLSLWYSIDNIRDITYGELKDLVESQALTAAIDMILWKYDCTVPEAEEAVGYIKEFIRNVEEEFN